MLVTRVTLNNFRNLDEIQVAVSPRVNILLGRNGQGKTNFLEGLSYLALGRSWRTSRDRELIRFGEDSSYVCVEGRDDAGDTLRLEAALLREGTKRIKVDGQPLVRQADLVGNLSVVRFDPEEVELAKGGPEHRRRFLDYTLSLSSADYFRHLLDYRRAVAQKNRLLKQRRGPIHAELDVWDAEIVKHGVPLLRMRAAMREPLELHAREAYAELAPEGGRLDLEIQSTIGAIDGGGVADADDARIAFEESLGVRRADEIGQRQALVGPHRDQLEVKLRGRPLRRFGSQGEKRSASIALKLAQGELLYERTRRRPVVLLDDIFSELDKVRTEALQRRLHREHQIFIATARVDHVIELRDWEDLRVWTVRRGRLTEVADLDAGAIEFERAVAAEEA